MASDMLELMDSFFEPVVVVPEGHPCHMRHCHRSGCFPDKFKWLGGTLRAPLRGVRPVFHGVCPTTDAPLPVVLCFGTESMDATSVRTLVYVGSAPELEQLLEWRGRECYFDVMRFHTFGGSHARAAFDVVQCVGLAEHAEAEDPGLNLMAEWAGSPATLCEYLRSQADAAMCLLDGLMFLALGVLEVHSRGFERESAEQLHRLNLLLLSTIPGAGSVSVKAARRVLQSFCQQPADTLEARCQLVKALEVLGMVLERNGSWMQALVYLGVVHELAGSGCERGQAPPPLVSMTRLVRLEVMRESLLGPGLGLPKLRTSMLDPALSCLVTSSLMLQLDFEFADVKHLHELPADIAPEASNAAPSERMLAAQTKLRNALTTRKSMVSLVHESRDAGFEEEGSTFTRGVQLERYLFQRAYLLTTLEQEADCLPHASLSICMQLCLRALRTELLPTADATAQTCEAPASAFEAQLAPFLLEKKPTWLAEQALAVLALCEGELGSGVQAQYKACFGDPTCIRRETTRQAACAHAHINLSARLKATQPDASYKHMMKAYKYQQRLGLDEPHRLVCASVCDVSVFFVLGQMVLMPGPQSSQNLRERMALKLLAAFFVDVCQDVLVLELVIRTLRASYSHYTSVGSYANVARILLQLRELSPMDYGFLHVHIVRLEHADGVLEWHVGGSTPLIIVCRSMLESVQSRECPYLPFTGASATEIRVGDCFFVSLDGKLVDAVCTVACRSACAEGEHPMAVVVVGRVCHSRGRVIHENTQAVCKYQLCSPLEVKVRVNLRVEGRLIQYDQIAGAPFLRALEARAVGDDAIKLPRRCPYVFFHGGYEQVFAGMTPLGCLGWPLVVRDREHLDVVAVQRADLGQCRLRRRISSVWRGCALQLADKDLHLWLQNDMPALAEHPELVFRLVAAVDRRDLPATMLAEKSVLAFLGQLTRVDEPARACAETMARVLCAERHAGFYGLRACMQRFVGLTGQGLLDDASRWLVHVQERWGVHVLERVRAGGEPRLGSFDALSLQLFFVLHLLPAAEFVLAPPGTVDLEGDDHRMLVCKAVDRLEICEKMLAQQWCSPAQRALLHACMAQGLRFLGRNKKRLASCVRLGEAALRECLAETAAHDVLLDKRVLKGWTASRLHTLTLQEAMDVLLLVHAPARPPAVAPAPEPARAAVAASLREGAPVHAERPPLGVEAEPQPPAVAPAPEPTRAAVAASLQEGAPVHAEQPPLGVDAELAPPSNYTACANAPDDQDESLCTCIVCMEHQVVTGMPCARAYRTLAALTLPWRWQRTHVLMPCRHFSLCHSCVVQLSQCPLCNQKIEETLRIYM